jgi:hypothetical protein
LYAIFIKPHSALLARMLSCSSCFSNSVVKINSPH